MLLTDGPVAGQRCQNKQGYSYREFEAVLFGELLSDKSIPVLRDMIPPSDRDDSLGRRIDEVDAKIANADNTIERLLRRAGATDDDNAAAHYEKQAQEARVLRDKLAIDRDRYLGQRAAQSARLDDQIAKVRTILLAPETPPQDQEDARFKLNQLLGSWAKFILCDHRTITVEIVGHSGLAPVVVTLTQAGGLVKLDVLDDDGTLLTRHEGAGLALLNPIAA